VDGSEVVKGSWVIEKEKRKKERDDRIWLEKWTRNELFTSKD